MSILDRPVSISRRLRLGTESPEAPQPTDTRSLDVKELWEDEDRKTLRNSEPPKLPVAPSPEFGPADLWSPIERVRQSLKREADSLSEDAEQSRIKAGLGVLAMAGDAVLVLKSPGFGETNKVGLLAFNIGEMVVEAGAAFYTIWMGLRSHGQAQEATALRTEIARSRLTGVTPAPIGEVAPVCYLENNVNSHTT